MTNLEIVRAACIKAQPSIIELTIGCNVLIGGVKKRIVLDIQNYGEQKGKYIVVDRYPNTEFMPNEYEIVGRPIRLADVLLAIKTKIESGKSVFVPSEAGDKGTPLRNMLEWIWKNWNLLKDDLEDQSPETLAFLASLLSA